MARLIDIMRADNRKKDKTSHDIGWPHYARNGNCICNCKYCYSKTNGCICRGCEGHNHANCKRAHLEGSIDCSQMAAVTTADFVTE